MHATILVALIVCIAGGIAHVATTKLSTLGLWAFAIGLYWTLAAVGGSALHVG